MTERERAQERAQRRRGHHPMAEHPGRRTSTQHVGVIDVGAPAIIAWTNVNTLRPGRAPPTRPTRRTVESINASNPSRWRQRRDQQQTGVGDQVRLVEDDVDAVDPCDTRVTGSASWPGRRCGVEHRHCPSSGGLSGGYAKPPQPASNGGSRLSRGVNVTPGRTRAATSFTMPAWRRGSPAGQRSIFARGNSTTLSVHATGGEPARDDVSVEEAGAIAATRPEQV